MKDKIFERFLQWNYDQGMALAAESDLLDLSAEPAPLPQRYVAEFYCKGLVRSAQGQIEQAEHFAVGIYFPPHYLHGGGDEMLMYKVLTWLDPADALHPNIRAPFVCVGRFAPGTALVALLYQLFDIIVFHKWSAHDHLCPDAAQWARNNFARFPIDPRPLKWRRVQA